MATASIPPSEQYERTVRRLITVSEERAADAYEDVPWDEPGFELDPTDPRLELFSFDPLGRTAWYQELEPIERARVGLRRAAGNLKVGWEFENLLQQGLLVRAMNMGNSDVAFTYVHHEIAEESHHSMMFYEFVRRYAPEATGMRPIWKLLGNPLVQLSCRRFPELFFVMVLGGEVPVDHLQRLVLKEERVHPLLERIMAIHVEEEARHVGFANQELRRRIPAMSTSGRHALAMIVPAVLGIMARMMVLPTPALIAAEGVPRDDVEAAYRHPETRQLLADSVARIRTLLDDLGAITPASRPLWIANGIWDEPRSRVA